TLAVEKQKETVNSPSPAPSPHVECAPEEGASHQTAGHKIHNELTYRGVDWLLNSTVGVASTIATDRTELGKKWFSEPVTNFFKKALAPILKNPAQLQEGATWGRRFASIMAGGFAIIPVMMVMENKKVKKGVVRWLDEKMYGKETVAEDPKFHECYEAIDKEPEKGLGTGMASRLLTLAPLIAVTVEPRTNMILIKKIYQPIGNFSKRCALKLGIKPNKWWLEKGAMEHLDGNPKTPKQFQNNWDFLHATIGFDFGMTALYSVLHEAAYKTLAALGMKKDKTESVSSDDMLRHGDAINDFSGEFKLLEDKLAAGHAKRVKKAEKTAPEPMQSHSHRITSQAQSEPIPQL
ncbi:MAG: hypothetical protein EBR02_10490, partial [Alphaproteobacteria bacterium]|nr:hypothetical protein [Alphaproteobacteria bacterium]